MDIVPENFQILLLYIRTERTGDWKIYLQCVPRMIPIFHSGGHTAYAHAQGSILIT